MHGRVWITGTQDQFDALRLALWIQYDPIRCHFVPTCHGPDKYCLGFAFAHEDLEYIEPDYTYWLRVSKMARKIGMNVEADGVFAPKEK